MSRLDAIILKAIQEVDNALKGFCEFKAYGTDVVVTVIDYDNYNDCWNDLYNEDKVVAFLNQLKNRCLYKEAYNYELLMNFNEYNLIFQFSSESEFF